MAQSELNPPQAEAVAYVHGPLLVFAGAGSGKTRVITYRIANLVANEGVMPWRILAVTFTNKAAGEMRARLEEMLGSVARDLWVGTFHATCAKFLRLYPEATSRSKNFVIYDSSDQKAVITRALRDLGLDDRSYPPKQVLARIHKLKQEGRGPHDPSLDKERDKPFKDAYARYELALQAANAFDFEDLIVGVVRILEASADGGDSTDALRAKEALESKFDFVLVDEFQDTNAIQYRLLKRLTSTTRNLCVVGDDDQSIYRWRGADVRNIRGFRRDYPDAKVIKLEQNYRSTKRIVASALAVIAPSRTREPKELWTSNVDGSPIRVIAAADERDEAACVVRAIRDAADAGIARREIAVFYRVHAQSRVLEEALRSVNIPYQIIGGAKFYERAEVKDIIAYLRVLVNPKSDVDMMRIINTPARGIGATTVERIAAVASMRHASIFEALANLEHLEGLSVGTAPRKRLGQFRELINGLIAESTGLAPAEVLRMVLEKSGYRSALKDENTAEADARLENLAELEGSMHDYAVEAEARGEEPTLEGFLERVTLQSDTDSMSEASKVTLMTVHSAKGLEYRLVLLTGMEESIFPYRRQEPLGHEEMDEERRLAYVAVTRAREHLVVTHAKARQIFGTTRLEVPSRFLGDFPAHCIEQHETPAARGLREGGRWIDRSINHDFVRDWTRAPKAAAPAVHDAHDPGDRYIEIDAEASQPYDDVESPARGTNVLHPKFGRGEVLNVVHASEPAVVAFFPGWGEKKVLVKFLKRA
ncbi:MAG: UvrD-helicase domain-containing protein [Polyangiaceae bacterium]|nr:UvrD-helicase domain-containing protein [Polyangiaceae bacterium]